MPVVFLLLFVCVFGGTLGAGPRRRRAATAADYIDYLAPGILVMTVARRGHDRDRGRAWT